MLLGLLILLGFLAKAQAPFCQFSTLFPNAQERFVEATQTCRSLSLLEPNENLVEFGSYETKDKLLRFSTFMASNDNGIAMFQWQEGTQCVSRFLTGNWVGKLRSIQELKLANCKSYLLLFERLEENTLKQSLCYFTLKPGLIQLEEIKFTDENHVLLAEANDWLSGIREASPDGRDTTGNYFELLENGFTINSNMLVNGPGVMVYETENYLYAEDGIFSQDIGSVNVWFEPDLENVVDTIKVIQQKIGNKTLSTILMQSWFMTGRLWDYGVLETFSASYLYDGQTISSSEYNGFQDNIDEKKGSENDTLWNGFKQFIPEYLLLADGSVIFRTLVASNQFAPGMCGACDYITERFIQIKKGVQKTLISAAYMPTNDKSEIIVYHEGKKPTVKTFGDTDEEEGYTFNYIGTKWTKGKGWQIRLGATLNGNEQENLVFIPQFIPQGGFAKTSLLKAKASKNGI
ncbi:MAG: hypothetical protein K9H61_09325 [Bacteroidia bacterium]|nr:hypothetical protein [Bacteroidia bacterium]MCF8447182.1 hypothetical protein [Bacteroidia bacterium]